MRDNFIHIKAVGDICPGDKYIMGLGVLSKSKKFGTDFPLRQVKDVLQGTDIVLGNFEGLLTVKTKEGSGSDLTFCGLPEFAQAMARSGVAVLNVANNHSLEHGPEIFLESVEHLRTAGIKVCGLRSNAEEYYSEPVILSVKGQRIGFLGYNWVGVYNFKDTDEYIAQSHDSLVNYTWDRKNFCRPPLEQANKTVINDIKKLRSEVDFLIIMTHWGYEYVTVPPYNLTIEARSFIDAGADIIIGCHPHVLQGMETYNGGLIFYSLGNFIFDFRERLPRYTTVLDINIGKNKEFSYNFKPLYINKHFQPRRASLKESNYINSIISTSSNALILPDKCLLDDDALYKKHEAFYNKSKLNKILNYLSASIKQPFLIIVIVKKFLIFTKIIWARLQGKRIRW